MGFSPSDMEFQKAKEAAAREIAVAFGVSNAVIGLTIVAVGTSLPELATAIVSAWRGHAG